MVERTIARRGASFRFRAGFAVSVLLALLVLGGALLTNTSTVAAAPGDHIWSKRFGDAGNQYGFSTAVDGAGNVFLTGEFDGSVDFGGGPLTSAGGSDIFLAKFDAAGNHIWSKRFGDADSQYGYSVAVDGAGNVFLSGAFFGSVDFGGGPLTSAGDSDIFLAKFDSAGNHLWSKRFGDADSQANLIVAVDGAGDVLLTGGFSGSVDFGGGPLTSVGQQDVFLAKLDSAGNHLWSKRFGDADPQYGYSVAVDGAGNVLLTGGFAGSVDFGGGSLTSVGQEDVFLAKFDSVGNHLWSKRFGDAGTNSMGLTVAVDGAGNVLLTGHFAGSVDFGGGPLTNATSWSMYLAKFDSAGNHLWSKGFGDSDYQAFQIVAVDGAGDVLLTGGFSGSVDFGGGPLTSAGGPYDVFLAKFDSAGNHLWSRRFGDADNQVSERMAVDGTGDVLLTGDFIGSLDFGGGSLTSAGGSDIFLAKFNGSGFATTPTPTRTPTPPPSVGGISIDPGATFASERTASHRPAALSFAALAVVGVSAATIWFAPRRLRASRGR
jgi:hypothetical protein